jgi:DNA-binding transcriptional LysR family regulator
MDLEYLNTFLEISKQGSFSRAGHKLFRSQPAVSAQLRIPMELPSVGMIKRFVATGLGVSIISSSFARDEVRAGKVKLIEISDVDLWPELGLVYRRDRTLQRSAAALVSMVRNGSGDSDHGHTGHSAHTAKKKKGAK